MTPAVLDGQHDPQETLFVSCYGQDGEVKGSRLVRSRVLVSPDGRFRAYATVHAKVATEKTGKIDPEAPGCTNTTKLFVGRTGSKADSLVYLQPPFRWELGNGIVLVDWSPDSRTLLVQVNRWQYESDAADFDILLVDANHGVITKLDHNRLFSERFQKECFMSIRVLGFGEDKGIVFEAEDYWPAQEPFGAPEDACVSKRSLWLLKTGYPESLSPLPEGYKVPHYGRVEKPAS